MESDSQEQRHTETPWHSSHGYIWGPQMEMIGDTDDEEAYVLRMRGVGGDLPIEANRDFICLAVNAHEALVEAATFARNRLLQDSGDEESISKLNTALALASQSTHQEK